MKNDQTKTSIRVKITRATVIAFLFMFMLLFAVYYNSMQRLLIERENDNMRNQVLLAESVLQSSVNYLPSVTRDWSSWDLTFDYVEGRYDQFLEDYLTEYPFNLFRLNFLTVLDTNERIIYEKFYDFWESTFMQNPPDLTELYKKVGPATASSFKEGEELDLKDTTQIGRVGFVNHDGQVYYLSSYPILHSDETGPIAGTFIFGRIIDQKEMQFLTSHSGMTFSVQPLETLQLSMEEKEELSQNENLVVTQENNIIAYTAFPDLLKNKNLAISYSSPRTLYNDGNNFIRIITVVIALCCIGVLAIIITLLGRIIIKPLGKLVDDVDKINLETIEGKIEPQVENLELDNLSTAVNDMLLRIKTSRDEIAKKNQELYHRANYDMLTGLSNRFKAISLLEETITKACEKHTTTSVFYFDLDRFKFINDTWGHSTGDSFIVALSERLQKDFYNDAIIARMGGDEFLIIAKGLKTPTDRQNFADRIFKIFERPFMLSHRSLQVDASVGSSTFPDDGNDAETLIKNAEIAMFKAKELGNGLYIPYQEELQTAVRQKIYIENKLRSAINDGCKEFRAYFQPKLDITTGRLTGCEALIRWLTPEGIIPPMDFIPQAEESGLILPLSWWMIRQSCLQCARFQQEGIDCTVSVNVSAQVLLHNDFLSTVQDAVQTAGIPYSKLDIEILEQTLVEDIEKVNRIFASLHALGVEISVDDFGTGYSSLSYLNKMAVDRIKIDRSFVWGIGDSAQDRAIINAIIAMGKSLRVAVTAEGVETKEQYSFLKNSNCDEAQGFLISQALPADEFITFMQNWKTVNAHFED